LYSSEILTIFAEVNFYILTIYIPVRISGYEDIALPEIFPARDESGVLFV